jgi:hypothetical protein
MLPPSLWTASISSVPSTSLPVAADIWCVPASRTQPFVCPRTRAPLSFA